MGVPVLGSGVPVSSGPYFFVNSATGAAGNTGTSTAKPFSSIQRAVNAAVGAFGAVILVAPGAYNESVTIPRPTVNAGSEALTIMGMGTRTDVAIAPSTTDAGCVINNADDVTFINIGMAGNGAGTGFINTGSRVRVMQCRFENQGTTTGLAAQATIGTTAQRTAGTHGGGNDLRFIDCEFANSGNGLLVTCTSGGSIIDLLVDACRFHTIAGSSVYESVGSGGAAASTFRNLLLRNTTFGRLVAGTEPANYVLLNANNANSGMVTGCSFPSALAGGKALVSTAVIWSGNLHTGGISTTQPS